MSRAARRMVDGGRGLSAVETLRWFARRDRPVEESGRCSAYTAAFADEHRTTRILVHNYWTEAFGIDGDLTIEYALIGEDGTNQANRSASLAENATTTIDVRQWCRDEGLVLPFTGQVLIETGHERIIARRPLQVIAEYLDDNGGVSSVHGQYGRMDRPLAQTVGSMRLAPLAEGRTAVVSVNSYEGHTNAAVELLAWNRNGDHRRATLAPLGPGSSQVTLVDEVISDLDGFLGGAAGHVAVRYPFPAARAFTFVEHSDGARVGDHGTIDRASDTLGELPPDWVQSRAVVSLPVLLGDGRDTVIGVANRWGARVQQRDVVVALHTAAGARVAEHVERIKSNGFAEISMAEVVRLAGLTDETFHAELWVDELGFGNPPATIDALVGFVVDGRLRSEVQAGAAFFNADVPSGVAHPDVRRTRVFGATTTDETGRLFLAHPVGSDDWESVATAVIRLVAHDGTELAVSEVAIPAHGFIHRTIPELFPRIAGAETEAILKVRSTDARLYGYYTTDPVGAPTFATCHLIGG